MDQSNAIDRLEGRLNDVDKSLQQLIVETSRLSVELRKDRDTLQRVVQVHERYLVGDEQNEGLIIHVAGLRRSEKRRVWRERAMLSTLLTIAAAVLIRWLTL